jgi:hypothetical protein
METPIRELPRTDVPRPLIYATSLTCGVMAAMAVQILLSSKGIQLTGVWRNLLSPQALQVRSAGAWWLMAGSAFLVSSAVAASLSRLPLPWSAFRTARWFAAGLLVFGLAEIGHIAMAATSRSSGAQVAVSLAALGAAGLMALFGAYFAARR